MAHIIQNALQIESASARGDLRSYVAVRAFILLLMVAQPFACFCQLPAAPTPAPVLAPAAWQRVERLPLGTSIKLNARTSSVSCAVGAVDDNSLTCVHGKRTTFARTDVVSITTPHRGRSALILGGIGAGLGIAVVKIVATAGFNGFFDGKAKGAVYAGGAALGVLIFAPIGYSTDFTHTTLY